MADATKTDPKAPEPKATEQKTVKITYVPREGDPATTEWHGHKFEANKPRDVKNPQLIEAARSNPWFEVEGEAPKRTAGKASLPTTAEEYRAYAVDWMRSSSSYDDWQERWDKEQALRDKCGVGADDLDYFESTFGGRKAELKRAR